MEDIFFHSSKVMSEKQLVVFVELLQGQVGVFRKVATKESVPLPSLMWVDQVVEWNHLPTEVLITKTFGPVSKEERELLHSLLDTRALKDKTAAAFIKELVESEKRKNKWAKMVGNIDANGK